MNLIADLPGPSLEVRDLRVVLAVAKTGSTARAAELLHITQSAVSRALLAVEEKLGTQLFDRTRRGLSPTAAAERFLEDAARLLGELSDLEHRTRVPERQPLRLRLVCECYTAYHWVPSALLSLRKSLPHIQVDLAVEHTGDPVAALASGEIDAALLTTGTIDATPRGRLLEQPLFSDEVVFLVAASHPLARKKTLARSDLREHTLISARAPDAENEWFMARIFGRARPRLRFERYPLTEAVIDVARAGLGIAVLSEWSAGPHLGRDDLTVMRLDAGPLLRPWRFAWRREVDDAARRLLSALALRRPTLRSA